MDCEQSSRFAVSCELVFELADRLFYLAAGLAVASPGRAGHGWALVAMGAALLSQNAERQRLENESADDTIEDEE